MSRSPIMPILAVVLLCLFVALTCTSAQAEEASFERRCLVLESEVGFLQMEVLALRADINRLMEDQQIEDMTDLYLYPPDDERYYYEDYYDHDPPDYNPYEGY